MAQLPHGRVLNLGAGGTGMSGGTRTTINVDVRRPATLGVGTFVVADGQALPFKSAAFDGALLKDIIEHVADPAGLLREVHRVLVPDGVILINTPRAVARAVWADYTHIRGFTKSALIELLRDTGWHILRDPSRMGALPGAGRLKLTRHLGTLMRAPGLGHWYGTNWLVTAKREEELPLASTVHASQ